MTTPLFLFGTLLDPELFEIVSGAPLQARPARLKDASAHWVAGESFPVLKHAPGHIAKGIVVMPDAAMRSRLDFYELGFGYGVETRTVETDDGPLAVDLYVPKADWPVGADWSLADWQVEYGALSRLAARDYMNLRDALTPEAAARAFPQIRMRAASRLRAEADPSPECFEPQMSGRTITPDRTEQPYIDYFAVREDWLSFPRFDGVTGPVVKRASFLGGDAVTVLPYDPRTESVLMIRQFRHGAFARGDRNAWTLEPAAGRIDPEETPEDTARRELFEETGVTATSLHLVGRYYPSPGAYSEYLYSYVATADLSTADRGIGGLASEAEDIMSHVVPLDAAMDMITTGAANTAPLILSLTWLALNKARLS